MTAALIPAALLLATTVTGLFGLRRFPYRVRIAFDTVCFLAIGLYFFAHDRFPVFSPLSDSAGSQALWLRAVGGAWWLLGSRIAVAGLRFLVHRNPRSREARMFSDLLAAAIYIAAAVVVINSVFALPITGVIATSGVVAIVLGMALQNILADVFAGVAVGIEAPFGVGDRIQIGDRIEGQVVQLNWRSTRIQTDGDDVAIIPNSLIAKAEIVNRSFPSQRRAVSVELTCPESAIPERVIELLLYATMLCPDILRTPQPSAVLVLLGSKRNVYRISFFVENTGHLWSTKDLLLRGARRQLHYGGFLDHVRGTDTATQKVTGDALTARRVLRDVVLFESLAAKQIDELVNRLAARRLEPGEVIFAEGSSDTSLYVIASGIVEITRQVEAVSSVFGCIGAGDYIGEISMLTGAPHQATAVARTHCEIYQLQREAVSELLSENAQLVSAFDKSARRGLELLHREVAVGATPDIGAKGQLLLRIRSLLHFDTV